jgi:peptidoglycan/xylan/chitin deacetylase (PgdA/CDA1 family)
MLNHLSSKIFAGKIGRKLLRLGPDVITHVETADPVAALTFDDGPHPVYTPRVLSILEKHGAKATFFMVGISARRYPEIMRSVVRAGHVIGNHSWNHPHLPQIRTHRRRLKQMWECAKATAPYCQRLFRPPFGEYNTQIRLDALLFRYKVILWNVSAQDWMPKGPEEIAHKMISHVTPGSIFLLHDAICGGETGTQLEREPMLDGLEMALAALKRQIRFLTVPELLLAGRPVSK